MKMKRCTASSRARHYNTGTGPTLQPIDIGHPHYLGLLDPDTAFWALVRKDRLSKALTGGAMLAEYRKKRAEFLAEMERLRFGLIPSAVYFNPTERCNLNCDYCYIPEKMRRAGPTMSSRQLMEAMEILRDYFREILPRGGKPQVIFHGSEPMLCRDSIFAAIDAYKDDMRFGVQTNGTLLDDEAIEFLTSRGVGLGLSLDGHTAQVADRTRRSWRGIGAFRKVVRALERLANYPRYNVLCTVTTRNMRSLTRIVDFFHSLRVPVCMLNPVRCTQPGSRPVKPKDAELVKHYLSALARTEELYKETGRKLVVANFANVLVAVLAPTARRLMCDISPCGGGRCFFAVSAKGDLFPCSEFVGLEEFKGGNLFDDDIPQVLASPAFGRVTGRKIEDIEPCRRCAVRHFCGAPCPAEAYAMNGGLDRPGAFCELYEEQVRFALRLIADGKENCYLWDGWDRHTSTSINLGSL